MQFGVLHQESYSRGQLLLRAFFGIFYIIIPHMFILYFLMIAAYFTNICAFWVILITGKYPRGLFNFHLNLHRWTLRLQARMLNLSDGYPSFGLSATDPHTKIEVECPEKVSRLSMLARVCFGFFYVIIPHGFILMFVMMGVYFVNIIAFWAILIVGKYPKGLHTFVVGALRWQFRVGLYLSGMSNTYPPFTGDGDEADFNDGKFVNNTEVLDQF